MSLEYRVGDVYDRLQQIPDGSIDLIVTSPPFLALRSYLPADHPHKHLEIGSEATPADFIDTLLALTAEFGRVLAPHGSICVELGDTYSGSGGAGGDYNKDGLREEQQRFRQQRVTPDQRRDGGAAEYGRNSGTVAISGGPGWPLPKSLTGIPTLYPWSLAYNRNLLTGQPSPAGPWRIRNLIVWARPNPPVGALGDKFRPATSYITVACRGAKRYFDLDAVRTEPTTTPQRFLSENHRSYRRDGRDPGVDGRPLEHEPTQRAHPAGAPPLDWHQDLEDGDWLWKLPTQPYAGSHYATFPLTLPKRLIAAMCPQRVCTVCGKPSERIVEKQRLAPDGSVIYGDMNGRRKIDGHDGRGLNTEAGITGVVTQSTTLGWSDCACSQCVNGCGAPFGERCSVCNTKHDNWRTGIVLDPFAGSGTTLEAAQIVGRHAIGIDLDPRNADLARDRVGMFMTVDEGDSVPHISTTPHKPLGDHPFPRAGWVRNDGRTTPQAKDYGA